MTLRYFFGRMNIPCAPQRLSLKSFRAEEISTRLICVCVPELAAFARRRRHPIKPSDSILNGAATTRRINPYESMRHGSSDEQALWDGIKLKETQSFGNTGIFEAFPAAIVTDIESGVKLPKGMSRGENLQPNAGLTTRLWIQRSPHEYSAYSPRSEWSNHARRRLCSHSLCGVWVRFPNK